MVLMHGGRDMRSFAGLYFIVRPMPFLVGPVASIPWLMISNNDPYLPRSVVFVATSLVIALCRRYNKMYINMLDSLLLAHLGILCHLISSYPGFQHMDSFVYTGLAMVTLPFVCFMLFFIQRAFRKAMKYCGFERSFGKCKTFFHIKITNKNSNPFIVQPLLDSTCTR